MQAAFVRSRNVGGCCILLRRCSVSCQVRSFQENRPLEARSSSSICSHCCHDSPVASCRHVAEARCVVVPGVAFGKVDSCKCKLLGSRTAKSHLFFCTCVRCQQRQRYAWGSQTTGLTETSTNKRSGVAAKFAELQQLATGETFVNKILGSDCYTKSLDLLDSDCSRMDSEKKSRLAMALANCHLEQLGQPTFICKRSMNLKQCADNMRDNRMYSTYLEFLSNIDT